VVYRKDKVCIDLKHLGKVVGQRKQNLYFFAGKVKIDPSQAENAFAFTDQGDYFSDESTDAGESSDELNSFTKAKTDYFSSEILNQGDEVLEPSKQTKEAGSSTLALSKAEAIERMTKTHGRLGHSGLRACKETIKQQGDKLGYNKSQEKAVLALKREDLPCSSCALAKSRRKHPKAKKANARRKRGEQELEPANNEDQFTADTAGPNRKSRRGMRYSHVVVLDKHAYSEVEFGKHKSEASEHIMDNYPMWKDALSKTPVLKTDRGGEYTSDVFETWLKKRGIRHKLTAPNSSAGSAEKKLDTLQNLSRAMINDSGAPMHLWDEAMRHANTITLVVPSASRKMKGLSPWESRWQEKPPVELLHPWGCEAFVNLPRTRRGRQDNKARKGMFLGLCKNRNDGWRFYDADLNSIFTGRSATFHDEVMYYKERARVKSSKRTRKKKVRFEGENDSGSSDEEELVQRNPYLPEKTALQERKTATPRKREQTSKFDLHLFDEAFRHDQEANATTTATTNIGKTLNAWRFKTNERYEPGMVLPSGEIPQGPDAFKIACTSEDKASWTEAIKRETKSLHGRSVMKAIRRRDVPRGQRPIAGKWVFDIKRHADGSVERYKARLVAKGFLQQYGRDYLETFSPTPSFSAVRLLAAMALQNGWRVDHLDVVTAFLYGELEEWERVYMEPPPGFDIGDDIFEMHKCLYGLKQSARKWFKKATKVLKEAGLVPSTADPCVFVAKDNEGNLQAAVAMHVDDILLTGKQEVVDNIKKVLRKHFEIKDLGRLSWYLGVKFTWSTDGKELWLSQEAKAKELLKKYRMQDCNKRDTPMGKEKLRKPLGDISPEEQKYLAQTGKTQTEYRGVVGSLRHLADRTRPDLAYATGQLARHMHEARSEHWAAANQVLRFLKGTANFGLRFQRLGKTGKSAKVVGWSDSDWGQDPNNRSSTSGYVFMYAGGAISWASKKQPIIARSTAEAELVALDLASREGKWLRKLERDLNFPSGPTTLKEDNQAAIAISEKHQRTQRTKHIDVQYFAICDDVEKGAFQIDPVASADNISDTFTKGLERMKFREFQTAMGVMALPAEGER
jgi:hypothetical protein